MTALGQGGRTGFSAIAILAALLAAGCSDADQKPPEKFPLRVKAATVAKSDFTPVVMLTGVITARTEDDLSFRAGGRIAERMADVGDHVEAGQVLARIDPAEQRSDIAAAQAAVDAAKAQVTQADAAFDRQKSLLARGFTTRRDYDAAEQASKVAHSARDAANSQLQNAKDALGYTELKAAAAGIVTARNAEAGQVVQAAQTIFTVAQDNGRDAVFNVGEQLVARPPPDLEIGIALVSDPAVKAVGRVREVSPVIDRASGTIRVKIGLSDPPTQMQLGAAVTGSVTLAKHQAVILPWQAMYSEGGAPAVWIVNPQTREVSLRKVGVLSYETGSIAIDSGLEDGEKVVVAGAQLLRPGLVVDPVEEAGK